MVIQRDPCSACSMRALRHTHTHSRCGNLQTQGKHILIFYLFSYYCLMSYSALRVVRGQSRRRLSPDKVCGSGVWSGNDCNSCLRPFSHFNVFTTLFRRRGGERQNGPMCCHHQSVALFIDVSRGWEAPLFESKTLRYVPSEVLSPLIVLKCA